MGLATGYGMDALDALFDLAEEGRQLDPHEDIRVVDALDDLAEQGALHRKRRSAAFARAVHAAVRRRDRAEEEEEEQQTPEEQPPHIHNPER